ncbi:hypothetical protein ACFRAQ_35075 [Nocardia sp. NPDC056611]|uniref:hypothetical protein n=1 Tax=Nocardia sp. NPDC056611 TaxID=3345877 RepID=UPI003670FF35
MSQLNTYVHVQDDRMVTHIFGPDDQVPEWAVKAISNPAVWADRDEYPSVGPSSDAVAEVKSEPDVPVAYSEPQPPRRGRKPAAKDAV